MLQAYAEEIVTKDVLERFGNASFRTGRRFASGMISFDLADGVDIAVFLEAFFNRWAAVERRRFTRLLSVLSALP